MTEKVKLERFAYTPDGTFGMIMINGFKCYTVERPWLDNRPNVSCIPEGSYYMRLGKYNRGDYAAYEILNVPERSDIKIHIGNTIDDVIGCVATGYTLGYLYDKWAVTDSRWSFIDFLTVMDGCEEAVIDIYQKKIDH